MPALLTVYGKINVLSFSFSFRECLCMDSAHTLPFALHHTHRSKNVKSRSSRGCAT